MFRLGNVNSFLNIGFKYDFIAQTRKNYNLFYRKYTTKEGHDKLRKNECLVEFWIEKQPFFSIVDEIQYKKFRFNLDDHAKTLTERQQRELPIVKERLRENKFCSCTVEFQNDLQSHFLTMTVKELNKSADTYKFGGLKNLSHKIIKYVFYPIFSKSENINNDQNNDSNKKLQKYNENIYSSAILQINEYLENGKALLSRNIQIVYQTWENLRGKKTFTYKDFIDQFVILHPSSLVIFVPTFENQSKLEISSLQQYLIHHWILFGEGKDYFTQVKDTGSYSSRSFEEVQSLRWKNQYDERITRSSVKFLKEIQNIQSTNGDYSSLLLHEYPELLQALKNYALFPSNRPPFIKNLVPKLKIGGSGKDMYNFLIQFGVWKKRSSPNYLRFIEQEKRDYSYPENYFDTLPFDPFSHSRKTIIEKVYCIDPPNTQIADDGISISKDIKGKQWLRIHVADATSFVTHNSPIERRSSEYIKTLYFVEETLPLFPYEISRKVSLTAKGESVRAISFACLIDRTTGEIDQVDISPSNLSTIQTLNYQEASEQLNNEQSEHYSFLNNLKELISARKKWLKANNLPIDEKEYYLPPSVRLDGNSIKISAQNYGESFELVRQSMELANQIAFQFVYQKVNENKLRTMPPMLYRYLHTNHIKSFRGGVFNDEDIKKFSLSVTSPIRKYGDFVNHTQLKSFLLQQPPKYSFDRISDISDRDERTRQVYKTIEQSNNNYWILKALEESGKKEVQGKIISSQKLSVKNEYHIVAELIDYGNFRFQTKAKRDCKVGNISDFLINQLDCYEGVLKISLLIE